MFLIHITAFLVLILCIARKFKIQTVEAFPVGCCVWILLFYLLAFFRQLSASDYLAVAVVLAAAVYGGKSSGKKRKELFDFVRGELLSAPFLTALLMTVAVTVCVSGKLVSWWDDYNFWATDAKFLYYMDGFARKYANAAPEFGDYPPATQMMKWWFLHFSPTEFKEGLLFAGYYFMNLTFLFPFLKMIRKRNVFCMAAGAAVLWLFPAVAEGFWCDGCCADLTMALVYGAFLVSVIDRKAHGRFFYYGRQALFLMILVLCKNTGFLWAAFGLFFTYGYQMLTHKKAVRQQAEKRADRRGLLLVSALPVLTELSWLLFCLGNRRVAKLTGTAVKMATGNMNLPYYQEGMVQAFFEAFFTWPLHKWKTIAIDLTPFGLYLLLLLFVYLLYRIHGLEKGEARYIGGYLAVSGIVFYALNLLSHLTIFAVETQYLEPFGMASSIERYGAPFTIGGLYLLAFCLLRSFKPAAGALICMSFVLLTTDYESAYRSLIGYRSRMAEVRAEREEIVDEAAVRFCEAVGAGESTNIGRVLYLRDISDVSWVRNTYIGFEAAPVSVLYGNVDTASFTKQDLTDAIQEAHAGFLYVDALVWDEAKQEEELFTELTGGEEFSYSCLYQVIEQDGSLRLVKFEE